MPDEPSPLTRQEHALVKKVIAIAQMVAEATPPDRFPVVLETAIKSTLPVLFPPQEQIITIHSVDGLDYHTLINRVKRELERATSQTPPPNTV